MKITLIIYSNTTPVKSCLNFSQSKMLILAFMGLEINSSHVVTSLPLRLYIKAHDLFTLPFMFNLRLTFDFELRVTFFIQCFKVDLVTDRA